MWKTVEQIDEEMARLDAFDESLKKMTLDLNEEIWAQARREKFVLVRAVQIRENTDNFRIEWCRLKHVKQNGTTVIKPKRMALNSSKSKRSFRQNMVTMGRLDQNHLAIVRRYDEKFAAIRELAEGNGEYRKVLKRMRVIMAAVGL